MATFTLDTRSDAATRALAGSLAEHLDATDVVTLLGEVGAGKTVFVRGVCEALAVPREAGVSSPTFALVNLYDGGRLPLAHIDLYRVAGEDELEGLGFRDLLASDRMLLIEWPERVPGVLEEVETIAIRIEDRGPTSRTLRVSGLTPETAAALQRQHPQGRVTV